MAASRVHGPESALYDFILAIGRAEGGPKAKKHARHVWRMIGQRLDDELKHVEASCERMADILIKWSKRGSFCKTEASFTGQYSDFMISKT